MYILICVLGRFSVFSVFPGSFRTGSGTEAVRALISANLKRYGSGTEAVWALISANLKRYGSGTEAVRAQIWTNLWCEAI